MIALPDCRPADGAIIDILNIGTERSPVILLDGATTRPDELVRYASASGSFETVTDNLYPGLRAPMPLDFVKALVTRLDPLIRRVYALGNLRLRSAECYYSLVSTPADRLKPFQTVPHIDTSNPNHFATVHYLCAEQFGGTAFFRQNATGFETISPHRENAWSVARDTVLAQGEAPAYPSPATPGYTRIAEIPAVFDRLTVYRSNALHAGIIDPALSHSSDPLRGRLTATMFIGYAP